MTTGKTDDFSKILNFENRTSQALNLSKRRVPTRSGLINSWKTWMWDKYLKNKTMKWTSLFSVQPKEPICSNKTFCQFDWRSPSHPPTHPPYFLQKVLRMLSKNYGLVFFDQTSVGFCWFWPSALDACGNAWTTTSMYTNFIGRVHWVGPPRYGTASVGCRVGVGMLRGQRTT